MSILNLAFPFVALIPSLGPMELIIIFLIVIVLFGHNRLAQIGKGLGEGIRNFKSGVKDAETKERLEEGDASQRSES